MQMPKLRIVEQTRVEPPGSGGYFAYFSELLQLGEPKLEEMAAFARALGASLTLEASGGRFRGMRSCIHMSPILPEEAERFKRIFAPGVDGLIETL